MTYIDEYATIYARLYYHDRQCERAKAIMRRANTAASKRRAGKIAFRYNLLVASYRQRLQSLLRQERE